MPLFYSYARLLERQNLAGPSQYSRGCAAFSTPGQAFRLPDGDLKRAWHGLIGDHKQVAASTTNAAQGEQSKSGRFANVGGGCPPAPFTPQCLISRQCSTAKAAPPASLSPDPLQGPSSTPP